ncbi:type II secretion system GspH family protein [Dehalococcoidia bacterium]|nr:type II secretion system GspH family protein [Dehalococcoidia bacterium]
MFITKIAKRLHRGEKGFTLIELLVVMAILAVLVGLVLPNLFGITDDADAIMIQGQHEKMREAVFLYHEDTGEWPNEHTLGTHDLWNQDISGWDGPYIERPILQKNRWGGHWGVSDLTFNVTGVHATYTVLFYDDVPSHVRTEVDLAMDDGNPTSGAVQTGNWGATGVPDRFVIVIAKQD